MSEAGNELADSLVPAAAVSPQLDDTSTPAYAQALQTEPNDAASTPTETWPTISSISLTRIL